VSAASSSGGHRYHFAYGPETPYARAVGLIERHRSAEGDVVLDLGCGFGAIAEPVAELGLEYLGVDKDPDGIADLRRRGFGVIEADLAGAAAASAVAEHLATRGRRLAAICLLDFLEHLPSGAAEDLLRALRDLSLALGPAPLVLSVPNVAHFDLAAKLVLGRWDVTPTGLLDSTHVSLYTSQRLEATTASCGWAEIARDDFELAESDQHFPAHLPTLAAGTPIHDLLYELRGAAGGALINQFVRAYAPAEAELKGRPKEPFLSLLVPTDAESWPEIEDLLTSLAAQSCDDFEVLLLVPTDEHGAGVAAGVAAFEEGFASRVEIVPVAGEGRDRLVEVGRARARGQYLSVLEPPAVVFAHHIEVLSNLAASAPGRVLQTRTAYQAPGTRPEPAGVASALPRSVGFHPCGPQWCGIAASQEVTVLVRQAPPASTAQAMGPAMDDQPVASARELQLEKALAEARRELEELRASTSWRATAPLRALSGVLRRRR
jgi:SAM-dependent methyltransferase